MIREKAFLAHCTQPKHRNLQSQHSAWTLRRPTSACFSLSKRICPLSASLKLLFPCHGACSIPPTSEYIVSLTHASRQKSGQNRLPDLLQGRQQTRTTLENGALIHNLDTDCCSNAAPPIVAGLMDCYHRGCQPVMKVNLLCRLYHLSFRVTTY